MPVCFVFELCLVEIYEFVNLLLTKAYKYASPLNIVHSLCDSYAVKYDPEIL